MGAGNLTWIWQGYSAFREVSLEKVTTELGLRGFYLNTSIFVTGKGEDQLTDARVYGEIVIPGLGERREVLMEGQREGL